MTNKNRAQLRKEIVADLTNPDLPEDFKETVGRMLDFIDSRHKKGWQPGERELYSKKFKELIAELEE